MAGRTLKRAYIPLFAKITDLIMTLAGQERFLYIYPHINADGDALGSALGVLQLVEQLGISCRILVSEPVPAKLDFLPRHDEILVYPDSTPADEILLQEQGVAFTIDSAGGDRLGGRLHLFEHCEKKVVMDHHISDLEPSATMLVDSSAAASCELVTQYALYLENRTGRNLLNHDIAVCLYTGMMTDTGRFTFSNTTDRTYLAAAELMRYEVPVGFLSDRLFNEITRPKLALIGLVCQRAEYYCSGRLLISDLPVGTLEAVQGVETDLEGMSSMLRNVEGVDCSVFLTERHDGVIRASVRSSEVFDSAAFSAVFGGGGHLRAAGFTLYKQDLASARDLIASKAGDFLSPTIPV